MPFAFLLGGTVLVISGVKGTSTQLLTLLKNDIQGTDGYLYWIVAILIIGSIGYVPALKPFSRAFLVLVLVVLVLRTGKTSNSGGGFFQQFTNALKSISQPTSGASSNISTSPGTIASSVATGGLQ